GTPVHGQTDGEGEVSYMVQLPGRLNITARYSGELVSKEIAIYEAFHGVKLIVDGSDEEEIYTDETASYTLLVQNIGNETDIIDIAIIDGIGTLNRSSLTLTAGANGEVLLSVSDSTPGEYSTTVAATSRGDPSKVDEITVITDVNSIPSSGTGNTGTTGGGGGFLQVEIKTDSQGRVKSTYSEESSDRKAELTIPQGTTAFDAEGKPLKSVSISSTQVGGTIFACNLGPSGATFDPEAILKITFDPKDVEEGEIVVIKVFDGTDWIPLDTIVNKTTNTATAKVSHFSIFALFSEGKKESGPTIMDYISESEPENTSLPSQVFSQPEEETTVISWAWLIFFMLVVAVFVVVVAYSKD
ncbi:MAG: hypothetical protein SVK08_03930, partial [Halobacteriota archaeon]|nr:hypothetical protein [Halobacteriota archaeon]